MAAKGGLVVVLCGIPGVGKATVGRILSDRLGATFVENHDLNGLVFRVAGVRPGGKVPFPAFDWTARMQESLREMVADLAPRGASLVFTHTTYERPAAYDAMDGFRDMAARIGARFLSVTLHCTREELARRICAAERRDRLKLANVDTAWGPLDGYIIPFTGNGDVLDTTHMSPGEAASVVEAMARSAAPAASPGHRPATPPAGQPEEERGGRRPAGGGGRP